MTATAAVYHEVRYRELGTEAWSDITRAPVTAELAVDGLDREKTYEFQVRAVSACGAKSVWVSGNYDTLTRTGPLLSEVDAATVAAQTAADNAQAAADDAMLQAVTANIDIGKISSDAWLTRSEKPTLMRDYDAINSGVASVQSSADKYAVSRVAHDAALAALNTYLAGLTPAWNDTTQDTPIVGATMKAKFSDYYAARDALLTTISITAKYLADSIVSGPGDNLIPNPTFASNRIGAPLETNTSVGGQVCDGWTISLAAESYGRPAGEITALISDGAVPGLWLAINAPAAVADGATVTVEASSPLIQVEHDASYYLRFVALQSFNGSLPSGVTAETWCLVQWLTISGEHISFSVLSMPRGASLPPETLVTAPSTAAGARVLLETWVANNSGALWSHNSSVVLNSIFQAVSLVRRNELETAGSGHQLGDARNQAMVTVGNFASAWDGLSVTYTSTTTSATFTVSAATLQAGDIGIAYGQSSKTVSGTAGSTVTYYLYYDDPTFAGGSRTLNATTTYINSINSNGRVYLAKATVTYPTSGTGGGGGPAPPQCVAVDARVIRRAADGRREDVRAGDIRVGDYLLLVDGGWGLVTYSESAMADRVRVAGRGALTCSTSAQLGLAGGGQVLAPDVLGTALDSDDGTDTITRVTAAGPGLVQHITCENAFFWARDVGSPIYYSHHNLKA